LTTPRSLRLSLIARLASRVVPDPGIGAVPDPGDGAVPDPGIGAVPDPGDALGVQAAKGKNAVDDLVAAHADAVYRYAWRLARDPQRAADLAQETLLRGWRARHKLREPAAARVWLLRIATNLFRDGIRIGRPTVAFPAAEAASPTAGVGRRLEQRECVERALAALDELPPRQRQVMHLVTIEQLTHDDAAGVLGISADALKASLSVARRQMREKLKDIYDDIRGARRDC
jgi:RNA polymerase sigma-70 factor, ECF subfamily